MLDIKYVRENKEKVEKAARDKHMTVDITHVLEIDDKRKELQIVVQQLQEERNILTNAITGKPTDDQIAKGKELRERLAREEDALKAVQEELKEYLYKVPNVPLDSVPFGESEDDNVVSKTVGEPTKFSFQPKNHWEIAQLHGWIDKERAAKVSGARFAYLKGDLVRLHFAVVQFVMQTLTDESVLKKIIDGNHLNVSPKGFVPVLPPAMVRTEPYQKTARLNKEETTYKIEGEDAWLNASAEHSLCPMYMDETLEEQELPLRFIGYSTSFRKEAGTYGKDMEGILRMHQFDKLEMESFTTPEEGLEEHAFLIAIQEYLMQELGLPYRVLQKCVADIGGPNAAGVDIEVWLPGQQKYRETHTADYMTDYQARRLQTRIKGKGFVHTNDATAMSQRPLIAILENYQQEDGSVRVPQVLQKWIGKEVIGEK